MTRAVFMTVLCCAIGHHAVARADDAAISSARQHYENGATAYRLGQYDRAIEEYKASYQLRALPLLLYDLGQAYRKLGEFGLALHSYEQYLAEAPPDSSYRAEAEAQVTELKALIEEQRTRQNAPPSGVSEPERGLSAPPSASEKPPVHASNATGWASLPLLGVAVVGGIAGGVLLADVAGIDPNAPGITVDEHSARIAQIDTEQRAAIAVLATGGAALAVSAACFGAWIHGRRHSRSVRASLAPLMGGGVFALGGEF